MPYKYPRLPKHQLRVGKSYSGLGLFTQSLIKKNDFVAEYHGPILDNDEVNQKGGRYLFAIDDNRTIDGTSRENIARYVNHSCQPNSEVELDGKRLFIYATKKIEPNQEITYDYGKEYFNDFIKPYGCHCPHHHQTK